MLRLIYIRWFILFIIGSLNITTGYSQLYINEILASNVTINPDHTFRNYGDWIEIYNSGSSSVDLINYTITDDINQPDKYRFIHSFYIGPHSYELIWADKEDHYSHTNFALDSDGEWIALVDPGGTIVDSITYSRQIPDISYGRQPDGSNTWVYFSEPTPASSNSSSGIADLIQAQDVSFSVSSGFYTSTQTVEISPSSPTATIHYTTDGSIPKDDSPVYSSPITISSTTVLKARCYEGGVLPGDIGVSTYFINESFDIPVVSLSTDPYYFFDWSWGIYVVGENGASGCNGVIANYFQDWERPINFEYFETDESRKVNKMVGTKIIGACSRQWPSKSLTLISREKYGERGLNYRFFPQKNSNSFKSLNLRNSGNDFGQTMLRDGFMQNLIKDRTDIDYQAYHPTVVFLNGEYRGILNLREKMNEHYVQSNYGINSDNVSVLENNSKVVHGYADHYVDLLDYINTNDLGIQANFDYVETQMDVDQYLDYYLANTYFDNQDWPHNNIRFWRENNASSRWRWMLFDTDFGFGLMDYYDGQSLYDLSSTDWSHDVIRGLMQNQNFEDEFIQRFAAHLNTTFEPYRVIGILDSIAAIIDSKMPRHIDRWGRPSSYDPAWLGYVDNIREYAHNRVPDMKDQIMDYFGITDTFNLTTSVSIANSGIINLCEVDITNATAGTYFDDIPIRLEAVPKEGYTFVEWTGDVNSTSNPISLTFSSDVTIQANFEEVVIPDIDNIYINEFAANNTGITDEHGEQEDWIEIYNANDFAVDIGGLYISDSINFPSRCRISRDFPDSTTIPPYGYLVLWADDDPEQGILHLNFKLDNDGEELCLVQKRSGIDFYIDEIQFNNQFINTTYGRYPDSYDNWSYLIPTPGSSNSTVSISGIVINEFSAENDNIIADEHGEYDDWIEIYNTTDAPVDIGGMFITDSLDNPIKHRIPATYPDSTTIPAYGHVVLWADNQQEQGVLHLGFKLRRTGEQIGLVSFNGKDYIDTLTYDEQYSNSSISRYPDGNNAWVYPPPTPGSTNIMPVISGLYINEFSASNSNIIADQHGDYDDWIEIYNSTGAPVNIGGLFLTDSLDDPTNHRIPYTYPDSTTIPAYGYLVLWADNQEEQGVLHLGFKLGRDGEQIGLAGYDGTTYIDSLTYGGQNTNSSLSRYPDSSDTWVNSSPTPGSTNTVPVILSYSIEGTNDLEFTLMDMPGNPAFNVYRDTVAYFTPDKAGGTNRIAANITDEDPVEQGIQWTDINVVGDVNTNYFYIFTGVGATESENSAAIGEFDYSLITTSTTDFNEIALPLNINGITNAAELMAAIPECNSVARWDAVDQGYYQYISFLPMTNFSVEMGYPYYVNVQGDIVLTLIGKIVQPGFSLITTPTTDFNEVMLTLDKTNITLASELMADIPSCNSIARWDAEEQGYYQYVSFLPMTNFNVKVGYPYYVNVDSDVTWPESVGGSGSLKSTSANSGKHVSIEKSSAPHMVYGTLKINDLSIDEGDIDFSAYINSAPDEILNKKSVGCTIQDGYWIIQCTSFPSGWAAGDKVIVEFKDGTGELLAEAEVELTFNPADRATDIILEITEGEKKCFLSQNIPNPFGYETLIQYQIPESGLIQIDVYSVTGQKVRTLVHEHKEEGVYDVVWNARDDYGRELQKGMYMYVLKSRENIIIRKALLLK